MEHYMWSFFQKRKTIKNVVRGIIMLEVQSKKILPKKLLIFIADNLYTIFLLPMWILKNKISIQHPNAKP